MNAGNIHKRTVRWESWNKTGLEHFSLHINEDNIQGIGIVIGDRGGTPYGLHYRVVADKSWRTREVWVQMTCGVRLHLFTDGQGHWQDDKGSPLAGLDGCIDIDIAATPFTNTLPIRRLDMKAGDTSELTMAYVPVPTLQMCSDRQRYTRLAERRFLYESADRSFSAELNVDEDGLVINYPGLFRRVV